MLFSQTYARRLWQYSLLTYGVLLVNTFSYLREIKYVGWVTPLFAGLSYLAYSAVYLLPMLLLLLLLGRVLAAAWVARLLSAFRLSPSWVLAPATVGGFVLVQLLLFTDKTVYHIFGFHLNGFIWNVVFTKGGIESMGGGRSTTMAFLLICLGIAAVQVGLWVLVGRVARVRRWLDRFSSRRAVGASIVLFLLAGTVEQMLYGVSSLRGYAPVVVAAEAFPLYAPITFARWAKSLGWKVPREPSLGIHASKTVRLRYPLHPIRHEPVTHPLNIIWLTAESLRGDMVTPEIMPHTYDLAQQANWFRHHYSGGNGTRMGMFSMFYGLYGYYWFSFLHEQQGPVLIDVLIDQGYQMQMFTGAKFTYPEFDKTIFARIPADHLHEGEGQPPWRRDRKNISQLLDFIDRRDPARPFLTFLFFEATHANYTFPREAVIRSDYAEDLNYATMDLDRDIAGIKARYVNAAHFVDSQIQRVLAYLRANDLLDSTIVLITGDHGEEFMEKGRWGHNSEFTEEQTVVPMVLWIPGRPAKRVDHITSHLDIVPTLMPLLGVTNPASDYCLGYDLLGSKPRDFTILCDWNNVAYVDSKYKVVFPTKMYGLMRQKMTTNQDREVHDRQAFYTSHRDRILAIMRQLKRFTR